MKRIKLTKAVLIIIIINLSQSLMAQNDGLFSKKPYKSQTYFSFGAGVSLLQGVPDNIYQDGHGSVQVGFVKELPFTKRFSFMSGIELERLTYNLDFFPNLDENNETFIQAPDGIKYTRVFQNSLNLSTQARFYFKANNSQETSNAFLQTGLRAGFNLSTTYSFRENDQNQSINLSKVSDPFHLQAELMLGFKGDYFKKLEILNASTFGVTYQFNSLLTAKNMGTIRPVHLTWRFLF
ncbi:outer membrane beta-barrel protein [Mongoliitalea daihaiensis]|uniref:outer membrane beta-barrel protein n=1 Tax=Mongoliitalea daihaiensis TaxID=2782006 RepID=UPI001F3C9E48|nr:outer membrane beta-barrel protein [Mongoliitalea daihaiensis]UJP65547.1 outer membrane beta-barrel protein [Mongoliitalea daihaiensis]